MGSDTKRDGVYDCYMGGAGTRIRQLREKLELSQEALARLVNVSKNTVTRWEADSSTPGGANLDRLAEVLGVSTDWILRGAEERGAPEREPPPEPPHWAEFIERYPRIGEISAEQLEGIRAFAALYAPGVRSWLDYERIAEVVRTSGDSVVFSRKKLENGS